MPAKIREERFYLERSTGNFLDWTVTTYLMCSKVLHKHLDQLQHRHNNTDMYPGCRIQSYNMQEAEYNDYKIMII